MYLKLNILSTSLFTLNIPIINKHIDSCHTWRWTCVKLHNSGMDSILGVVQYFNLESIKNLFTILDFAQ